MMKTNLTTSYQMLKIATSVVLIISFCSCKPSLLFKKEQFIGTYSDNSIPEKWQGNWLSDDEKGNCFISIDSFSIDGLNYKIEKSKLNLGIDTTNGRDKLIFQENWCFISRYVEIDSMQSLCGFQILIGNIDKEDNINCWEMSYDYFLKNRLVNEIPTYKLGYSNISKDGRYQKIEPTNVIYATVPEKMNKYSYNRLINKLLLATELAPYYSNETYNFDFFKKIAMLKTPDLILTKNKKVIYRKDNKNEIKYNKIADKNYKKEYLKMLKIE